MIRNIENVKTEYDVISFYDYIRRQQYSKKMSETEFNENVIKLREKILTLQKGK